MADDKTKSYTFDLPCGAVFHIFIQDNLSAAIKYATQANALLDWLGVPVGFMVFFWARNDPRILGVDEWPTRRNVNGGWAVPGSNQIVIYREEEWDRVLLHETIHALRWDWAMPSKPLPCWGFSGKDSLSPHLFEAWTELFAEWLWCAWHNVPWEKQRAWQDFQATQILARQSDIWKENTNIFAYYVLKAALAPYIEFLWAAGNGINTAERNYVLCHLVTPQLARLKSIKARPQTISLRMTVPSGLRPL